MGDFRYSKLRLPATPLTHNRNTPQAGHTPWPTTTTSAVLVPRPSARESGPGRDPQPDPVPIEEPAETQVCTSTSSRPAIRPIDKHPADLVETSHEPGLPSCEVRDSGAALEESAEPGPSDTSRAQHRRKADFRKPAADRTHPVRFHLKPAQIEWLDTAGPGQRNELLRTCVELAMRMDSDDDAAAREKLEHLRALRMS